MAVVSVRGGNGRTNFTSLDLKVGDWVKPWVRAQINRCFNSLFKRCSRPMQFISFLYSSKRLGADSKVDSQSLTYKFKCFITMTILKWKKIHRRIRKLKLEYLLHFICKKWVYPRNIGKSISFTYSVIVDELVQVVVRKKKEVLTYLYIN